MAALDALQLIARYKYLEAEYYRRGLLVYGGGTTTFSPGERAVVQQIATQESAQITQLQQVLGSNTPPQPAPDTTYDFSGGSGTGTGPFAGLAVVLPNKGDFFKLAQLFEDFGVRLIKAQLPDLLSNQAQLLLAARIHAVEGRHAAEIRLMRGSGTNRTMVNESTTGFQTNVSPWITNTTTAIYDTGAAGFTGADTDVSTQAYVAKLVYGGVYSGADRFTHPTDSESNPSQRGYAPASSEAYDEPIPADQIAPFLARFGVTV
jgi:hypothetical protein